MRKAIELKTGSVYGGYTVIKHIGRTEENKRDLYLVRCNCGEEKVLPKHNVISNVFGCHKCKSIKTQGDRGKIGPRLYSIWQKMLHRCYNRIDKNYNRYGGRGIKVCTGWKDNAYAFRDWAISNGYRKDLTIERIDTDGNYEPSNCRWATRLEQANNTSRNRFFLYEGETVTIRMIAEKRKEKYKTIYERIRKGKEKLEEVFPYAINS